jgi:hypothetical protein
LAEAPLQIKDFKKQEKRRRGFEEEGSEKEGSKNRD